MTKPRAPWLGVAVATTLGVWLGAASGCSSSSPHPAALGDCVPQADAACTMQTGGGGGGSGPGDSGGSGVDAGDSITDAGSCGTAGEVINASNAQCPVCIASSCCLAAAACTGPCLSLVQCPATTINSCAGLYPAGLTAYDDLASCVAQSCSTECPALPLAGGD